MKASNIAQLKINLYKAILLKEPSDLSDTEVEIGYWLAMDSDIQKKLSLPTPDEYYNFNPEFPELYSWGRIDSIALSNLASQITRRINHDLQTVDRNLVPGLRKALNLITNKVDI